MKTFINNATFAIATVAATFVSLMTAGETQAQTRPLSRTQTTQQQQTILPRVSPSTTQKFYFGFSVELVRGYGGTTLRLVSVTPGSPAQRAGLEVGDEIRSVNGQGFGNANNSLQAVRMLNRFVLTYAIGVPASTVAASKRTRHVLHPVPPSPVANMIVRNVRNGYDVAVTVRPKSRAWGGPVTSSVSHAR